MVRTLPSPNTANARAGAHFNVAAAALQGDPDAPSIVTAIEARPRELIVWPLRRLRSQAARVAWALKAAGVCPGEAVGLVLPLTADAVAVYLGIVLAVRSTLQSLALALIPVP